MSNDTEVPAVVSTTDITSRRVVAAVRKEMDLATNADALNKIVYEHALRHGTLKQAKHPLVRTGPGGDYVRDYDG
jgi:hypothetical protein